VLLFSGNLLENSENQNYQLVDILEEKGIESTLNNNQFNSNFAIQPFQTPRILFIVNDLNSLHVSRDEAFINYTRDDLGYNITIHEDNDSYDYQNYDAIVISRSIVTPININSIVNAPIPILIMNAGTCELFNLSTGIAASITDSIQILDSNHNITEGLTNDTNLIVYNQTISEVYLRGYSLFDPIISDIVSLATPKNKDKGRTIVTLEKGGRDWKGYTVAERRAFWGAAEGALLNTEGWFRWNRTLHWILYDYSTGSSSIKVNIIDPDNKMVENARVILNNSYSTSSFPSQNTTSTGQTTFNNIPYGYYNITVEFRTSTYYSLTLEEIAGNTTYQQEASFEYTIIIPDYVDNISPLIQNIHFDIDTYNFSAEIIDQSPIKEVFLNITVYNQTSELYIIPTNFTMIEGENNVYFNDTSLDTLNHTAVDIYYNIIAFDNASNVRVTPIQNFILEDPTPPVIHEYNVTDYGNGTLEFWANISDADSAVSAPVILKINDTIGDIYSNRNMYLNDSDLWVYRTEFRYNYVLNYTIYSVNDTVGNENGTKLYDSFPTEEVPTFAYVLTTDFTPPDITRFETTFLNHDEGLVEFTVYIEENATWQSGLNESNIQLLLSINDTPNQTIFLVKLFEGIFNTEYIFNYQDNITYWIKATDNVGNIIINSTYQVYRITDNKLPDIEYSAQEYGNGTITFFATVHDWPLNDTEVNLHYILEWSPNPISWTNISMNSINETSFYYRYSSFDYQIQDIWYYVSAIDSESNLNDPTLYNAFTINMTDIIKPHLFMTISNSTTNDGEITVEAYATDPFGETSGTFINNTISLNLTYKSITTSYDMIYSSFFTFIKNFELEYGEYVTITAYVLDNAGNQGNLSKSFIIEDYSPPKILQYGVCDYENGTVRIWAEVFEDEAGSGLPSDNSSVILTYAFIYQYTVQMRWNGSGNFYYYVIPDILEPGQAFAFNITAYDNNNNEIGTPLQFYLIQDNVKPFINDISFTQTYVNHTHVFLHFRVNATDAFGSIKDANFTISYTLNAELYEKSLKMNLLGSYYVIDIHLLCNLSCDYEIQISDESENKVMNQSTLETFDFNPTQVTGYGMGFDDREEHIGQIEFWITINNTYEDENVTLSVFDITNGDWILFEAFMNPMENNYSLYQTVPYNNDFDYIMKVYDEGVLTGYYNTSQYEGSNRSLDQWGPVIEDRGTVQINNTLNFWAEVEDWGSGIANVTLYLDFNSPSSQAGIASQEIKTYAYNMTFNSTHYLVNITFNNSVEINWYVIAFDHNNNTNIENLMALPEQLPIFLQIKDPFNDPLIELIISILFMSTASLIFLIFISFLVVKTRNRREAKAKIYLGFKEKLSFIPEIYSLVVTSGVGLPIINISNVLYLKDDSLNGSLSGLSVGIDSFLESFQSDFMSQLEGETVQNIADSSLARLSLIEKEHIQILIAASPSYRIFLFMKKRPPEFIKSLLLKGIQDIESKVPLLDQGLFDESLIGPQVLTILKESLPIVLLDNFIIDIKRIIKLDRIIETERDVGQSKNSFNALKQLVMVKTLNLPKMEIKQKQNSFKKLMTNNNIEFTSRMIYTEALNIMEKLLGLPYEDIFEALWMGSSSKIKIIIPLNENISI